MTSFGTKPSIADIQTYSIMRRQKCMEKSVSYLHQCLGVVPGPLAEVPAILETA